MKIKITIPANDPKVTLELDADALVKAFKEILEKLPFKVELKGKESGEH